MAFPAAYAGRLQRALLRADPRAVAARSAAAWRWSCATSIDNPLWRARATSIFSLSSLALALVFGVALGQRRARRAAQPGRLLLPAAVRHPQPVRAAGRGVRRSWCWPPTARRFLAFRAPGRWASGPPGRVGSRALQPLLGFFALIAPTCCGARGDAHGTSSTTRGSSSSRCWRVARSPRCGLMQRRGPWRRAFVALRAVHPRTAHDDGRRALPRTSCPRARGNPNGLTVHNAARRGLRARRGDRLVGLRHAHGGRVLHTCLQAVLQALMNQPYRHSTLADR